MFFTQHPIQTAIMPALSTPSSNPVQDKHRVVSSSRHFTWPAVYRHQPSRRHAPRRIIAPPLDPLGPTPASNHGFHSSCRRISQVVSPQNTAAQSAINSSCRAGRSRLSRAAMFVSHAGRFPPPSRERVSGV